MKPKFVIAQQHPMVRISKQTVIDAMSNQNGGRNLGLHEWPQLHENRQVQVLEIPYNDSDGIEIIGIHYRQGNSFHEDRFLVTDFSDQIWLTEGRLAQAGIVVEDNGFGQLELVWEDFSQPDFNELLQ